MDFLILLVLSWAMMKSIKEWVPGTYPGAQVASVRVDKLTFSSERSGTSLDRKPPLSSWDKTAPWSPVLWDPV